MSQNLYDLCPCGSGKKIKFCCKELASEIEKIEHMIEAGQRQACLDYILRLEIKHPQHVYLQLRKIELLHELGQAHEAHELLSRLLEKEGQNPVVLAVAANDALAHDELDAAIEKAHQALALSAVRGTIAGPVVGSLAIVATFALEKAAYFVAEGHLRLYLRMVPDDETVKTALANFHVSRSVPLVYKESLTIEECPDPQQAPPGYIQGMDAFFRFDWLSAEQAFTRGAEQKPEFWPTWHNLAVLRSWLGRDEEAGKAWRQLSLLDIPEEQAVRAEALAQILLPPADVVDYCSLELALQNPQQAQERAAQDERLVSMSNRIQFDGNSPPPKAIYLVLDRPRLRSENEATVENVPIVLGTLVLFGKETDREARIRVLGFRPHHEACVQVARQLGADAPTQPEDVLWRTDRLASLMPNLYLGADVTQEKVLEVNGAFAARELLERFPNERLNLLDGKTPMQAIQDPELRRRLRAQLDLLRLSVEAKGAGGLPVERLYERLDLPWPAPIDLTDPPADTAVQAENPEELRPLLRANAIQSTPPTQLGRIKAEVLDNKSLRIYFHTGMLYGQMRAVFNAAIEMLRRDDSGVKYLGIRALPAACADPRLARKYLEELRQDISKDPDLAVELDFADMMISYGLKDRLGLDRALQRIMELHFDRPGVRDRLIEFLRSTGLVKDEPEPQTEKADLPASMIWTPDSEPAPATPPSSSGSKLWLPE